jgi:uncharacterized protein with PQ loop repeat
MTVFATLAFFAGLATAVAPFAQARRIALRRSSEDVSLWWLGLYGAGCVVWLAYGISIASVPLIATQAIAAVGACAAMLLGLHFRDLGDPSDWAPLRRLRSALESRLGAVRREQEAQPPPLAVPAELVVEEARHSYFSDASSPRARPVVDRFGRAVGVLRRSDIAALPVAERASRLVADIADRDVPPIDFTERDESRVVARRTVARTGLAFGAERRRHLVVPSASEGRAQRRGSGGNTTHKHRGGRSRQIAVKAQGDRL